VAPWPGNVCRRVAEPPSQPVWHLGLDVIRRHRRGGSRVGAGRHRRGRAAAAAAPYSVEIKWTGPIGCASLGGERTPQARPHQRPHASRPFRGHAAPVPVRRSPPRRHPPRAVVPAPDRAALGARYSSRWSWAGVHRFQLRIHLIRILSTRELQRLLLLAYDGCIARPSPECISGPAPGR
jgi:hypothetical protein